MEDQEENSVEEEFATQETEQDESEHQEDNSIDLEASRREEEQERNWRAMRQRQKELEWEIKKRDEMLERAIQQNAPRVQEDPEVPDDDYATAGLVKGLARKTVQPLEKKIEELEARIRADDSKQRFNSLKSKYSDYDDVVNLETLELLEKLEPELAETIAEEKDAYKMGIQAYKYIKALGLKDKVPNARRTKEIDKKIEKNKKTVQSPLAYDKRPMAQAFKSTASDQKRLYEEMMHYAKQASGL